MSISIAKNDSQVNCDYHVFRSCDVSAFVIKSRQVSKVNLSIYPDAINWL